MLIAMITKILMQEVRDIIKKKDKSVDSAKKLIKATKKFMLKGRREWSQPEEGLYNPQPTKWLEELLHIGYYLSRAFLDNPKEFFAKNLCTQFISILFFAASQLQELDLLAPLIDQMVQNLVCANLLIPYFSCINHYVAVSLLIEAYHSSIKPPTVLCACIFLSKSNDYMYSIQKYLPELEESYPVQVACLRAHLLLVNFAPNEREVKCTKALELINAALENYPNDYMLLFNAAYITALLQKKQESFSFVQKAISVNPTGQEAHLLLIRLLRSNCQHEQVIKMTETALNLLGRHDRDLTIEAMMAAAEVSDVSEIEKQFRVLRKHYPKDPRAMEFSVRLNLILGNNQSAIDCIQMWSEFDQESPEFLFSFAQICLSSKDLCEAERYLMYAIELDPVNADYQASLANVVYQIGLKDKALDRARSALQADPTSVHAWLALSTISEGNEAKEALHKAIELRKLVVDLSCLGILFSQAHHIL